MMLAWDHAESSDCSETRDTSQASSLAAEANQATPPRVATLHDTVQNGHHGALSGKE
jgi:hypothetical protein